MNTHSSLIEQIFTTCKYSTYLELGVYHGFTLEKIDKHTRFALGVDIQDVRSNKNTKLFSGSTTQFFKTNRSLYDMIFIDADHNYDAVVRDFENSLQILSKNGTILIHDTDPESSHLLSPDYCNDSYKMNDYLNSKSNIHFITLPVLEAGLTLIKRVNDLRYLSL